LDQDSFVDEAPAPPEPVRIDSGSQPFGSLLETPAEEKEEEVAFMPASHAELVPERDWRDPDAQQADEGEEEEKPEAPWRPEAAESYPDTGTAGGVKDWRSGSFEQILARKNQGETWEPAEEKPELVGTTPAAGDFASSAPPAPTQATVPEAATPAGAISTTPLASDAWGTASSPGSAEKGATEIATAVEDLARVNEREHSSPETVVAGAPEATPAEPQTKPSQESWFSVPSNPWNAEIEKANRLASAWDSAVPVVSPPASSNGTEKGAEATAESAQKVIEQAVLPPAAVEAIREEAAHVAEHATQPAEQQNADGTSLYAPEAVAEAPATTSATAPNMDELVAKVLARMSPEVLQAVTREILKPVVEAMVKEEMKLKKS
jgi:hypothetical protein